ncbi:MAG: hypothetical protein WD825_02575 [Gemmatimonadaceae bacterium]
MTASLDQRIREGRTPKPRVDPWMAHGTLVEDERRPDGSTERVLTIFLSGSECPFTCSFCDLWRWTIDGPTPVGALPKQIADSTGSIGKPFPDRIKLYNASNFFDRRAVPVADVPRIAALCVPFRRVTVESHANTVGPMTLEFADQLSSRLEVAMGLETTHSRSLEQLNKRLELPRFDRAADFLARHDLDLRVFVLLGAPHIPAPEALEWTARSVEYAAQRGAAVVSIIPVRGGNGELERLAALGQFTPPTLRQLETALEACVTVAPAVVTADLWDVDRLAGCGACRSARVTRMRQWNLGGAMPPPIACTTCSGDDPSHRDGPPSAAAARA